MRERVRDSALLLAVCALLTLPNLGGPSLWDVDEGVNAEAAREMREAGTWVIPTFNYELRTAKPVMLYWLQGASYALFGVSEWSARVPSVLASWGVCLLVYALARHMFGRPTGLLAGLVVASALEVCVLAHAATPDATLLLFTTLTYALFWQGHQDGSRRWWVPTAAACGLAVLTKGPVGVALPGLVILLYFAWNRELGRLLDRKIVWAAVVFLLVAGPWYGLVTAETRGAWARAFFERENLQRFSTPMENHKGPFFYHAAALLVLFAPWSAFVLGALWYAARGARQPPPPSLQGVGRNKPPGSDGGIGARDATPSLSPPPFSEVAVGPPDGVGAEARALRFLLCWFGAYLVFFSAAATKLPNYMLPVYPALAIITARFLVAWRAGALTVPRWLMPAGVGGVALTGLAVGVGLLVAGDALKVLPPGARAFPGLAPWAAIGLVPLAAAVVMGFALRTGARGRFVRAAAAGGVAFTALAAAFPALAVDAQKAPRELVRDSGVGDPGRDLRVARIDWFQPSVVFYARREVRELKSAEQAAAFLANPAPGYLFVPEKTWTAAVADKVPVPVRVAARRYDFYRNCEVLVVTNQ